MLCLCEQRKERVNLTDDRHTEGGGLDYVLRFDVTYYTRHLLILRLVRVQSIRSPATFAVPIRHGWMPEPQRVFGCFVGFQRPPIKRFVRCITQSDL